MNEDTLLFRQVHPDFIRDGQLTSQAFCPSSKDNGKLSVYDGDQISARDAYEHYTQSQGYKSDSVWVVTKKETDSEGALASPDPLEDFPAHSIIDFGASSKGKCRSLAKKLRTFAIQHGCQYSPV